MDSSLILVFQLAVLIFSTVIHEISHGYIAEHLGDQTARLAGRLTLNPLKHLDFFGSFLLPVSLFLLSGGAFMFGWAKPVPYDPRFLKNPKSDAGKIAAAGPLSNLMLAVVFGILLRLLAGPLSAADIAKPLAMFFGLIVYLNLLLAVFNLVPLPPLDGSKVLFAFLPPGERGLKAMFFLERYGMIFLLAFVFFGFQFLTPIVHFLYSAITGAPPGF